MKPSTAATVVLLGAVANQPATDSSDVHSAQGDVAAIEPAMWQHAVTECNEAHAVLDKAGVPKTKRVKNRECTADIDITLGLRERIDALRDALQR